MKNLINNQKSLMISSLNENKLPEISYAPFVMIDKDIYVYLSKAANHYYNLANDKNCSVMIIEDEKDSKTIFARKRVSFECEATKLENADGAIYNKFDEVHDSSMMMVLKTLDFD
ncbi:pyridoxamine 5'-phosphate oxidase family protein, partial [Romboutsia sp. 1001216sp1]|uniref:pyridoxamine 5'-phosphate oxidase family protein n=2 Tax=Romboutsia TaxID=1501226 RepID=UPI00232B1DF9